MSRLRVAVAQMEVMDGDPGVNLASACAHMQRAQSADLILLPELWTTGYAHQTWEATARDVTPGIVTRLQSLSNESGIAIAGSMISRNERGNLVNRFWLHRPGRTPVFYDKIHLFRPLSEDQYLSRGTEMVQTSLGAWQVGLSICYDLRFPDMFARHALGGVNLVLCVSEWPAERSHLLRLFAQARAAENQVYLALCNRVGIAGDGLAFGGGSAIIAPDGSILAEAGEDVTIIDHELDTGVVEVVRERLPVLQERVVGIDSGAPHET